MKRVKLITPEPGMTGLKAEKIGRNDPCRCGSGRKAKNCCGNITAYFSREKSRVLIEEEKYKKDQ